ncbi:hypothetical protein CEXT_387251 [Caerostris extrusa]|uniref:Uncharacterized protein n=1 Tax=Caerostris extrusa TaxID=172846 RepID=A0AAV4RER8_CAEEX|nr:hypothetical protein CEXT_387251 [Caerostris extrusa]
MCHCHSRTPYNLHTHQISDCRDIIQPFRGNGNDDESMIALSSSLFSKGQQARAIEFVSFKKFTFYASILLVKPQYSSLGESTRGHDWTLVKADDTKGDIFWPLGTYEGEAAKIISWYQFDELACPQWGWVGQVVKLDFFDKDRGCVQKLNWVHLGWAYKKGVIEQRRNVILMNNDGFDRREKNIKE